MTFADKSHSPELSQLATEYWNHHLEEYPVTAMDCGVGYESAVFFKESHADYERRHRQNLSFRSHLLDIDSERLDGRDRVSYELLLRELDEAIQYFKLNAHLKPLWFPFGPDMHLVFAIQSTRLGSDEAVKAYVDRLASIPGYFQDCLERVERGFKQGFRTPEVLIEPIVANIRAHIQAADDQSAIWFRPLEQLAQPLKDAGKVARREILELMETRVLPAWTEFANSVEVLFLAHATESVSCLNDPGGKEYYEFLIRHHTTLSISAKRVHDTGRQAVAQILDEMASLLDSNQYPGNLADIRKHMQTDPGFICSSKQELITRLESLSKRIDRIIPEYFGRIPRMTYGLESIPEELSPQMPPAYAQPNPADRTQPGIHWVTSLPERCPSFQHIPLALHEAWPGHLMHIALLKENTDTPEFVRYRYENYTSLLEGWALYCERLGVEFGLYNTIYEHMGRLEMEMWRAVRLVVDTGLHTMSWTRDQAITYMKEHTSLPDDVIESEIDRYIGMPAQALAYKLGEMKVSELREYAEKAAGSSFDLRSFHDLIIGVGAVTLPLLEQLVREQVDTRSVLTS